jgi:hypothetical protein
MDIVADVEAVQSLRYHPHWSLGGDISELVANEDISVKGLVPSPKTGRTVTSAAPESQLQ